MSWAVVIAASLAAGSAAWAEGLMPRPRQQARESRAPIMAEPDTGDCKAISGSLDTGLLMV